MALIFRALALCIVLLLVSSCAKYRPMYTKEELIPKTQSILPKEQPIYTIYLTGSAGGVTEIEKAPTLGLLKNVLAKADENSAVLFMGDNVGSGGFPDKDDEERGNEYAKDQIKVQLEVVDGFKGSVTFLHGDKDWEKTLLDGAERQEDYIEKKVDEEIMLPENACGDPKLLELNDDVAVLIINSQWFLSDWNKYQEINEGCQAQSRDGFRWALTNLVKDVTYKHVVVAMHHPVITRGPRGGEHNLKTLYDEGNYGLLAAWWRNKIGVKQDLHAPKMQELKDLLRNLFDEHTTVTFASGHEYLLQYGRWFEHDVVGSGTAARISPGKVGQGTSFTAGVPGYAEIHYYENGESWLRIVEADGSPFGKTLFEQQLGTLDKPKYEGDYELYESDQDSIVYAPFVGYRKYGPLYKQLFGNNNRVLFETPYTYPIFRLEEFDGGLIVTKRGGGGQTNSLRLEAKDGREYVMRSIRKDPSRLLPAQFRVGPLITLTQDVFFSANPFGALAAAQLAEGVDIPHANPRIVYLPAQPALGDLNVQFADDIYLLEERPNDEWISEDGPFGNPDDIDGRDDVKDKIQESAKDRMDQEALVRARMLDILVGDFDRHDDQWRYAEYKNEETGVSYWRVIPRDRDQAMLKIDGKLLRLAGTTLPAIREIQNFSGKQRYIEDFTFQARMLDRRYLNELTREQWMKAAYDLKEALTDEEIKNSFSDWPAEARKARADQYIKDLMRRRDDLPEYAKRLYEFQAKSVYVVGTDEDDYFDVERKEDGRVIVSVYERKKGDKTGDRFYYREFFPDETKNIQLFGLREEDHFVVRGEAKNSSIKVRIVPGPEEDKVTTTDSAKAIRKRTRLYAWPNEDKVDLGKETEAHYTKSTRFNQYDYRGVDYDYGLWLPDAGFNVDDGVQLGALYQRRHYTYHRQFQQSISGTFATSSLGLRLDYNFKVIDVAPRFDVGVDVAYQTPSFAINYFGDGNETVEIPRKELPNGISYYRIRQELVGFYPYVMIRNLNHGGGLKLGLVAEAIKLDRDPGRFLGTDLYPADLPLFDRHQYAGTAMEYSFANVDKKSFPREGMRFLFKGSIRERIKPERTTTGEISSELTVYQHLWKGAVVASRVGAGWSFGDYYFYYGQTLGAGSLRGYRRERFNGGEKVFQNLDLRQEIGKTLHSRFGAFVSFDHGRVWQDEVVSEKWHYSYGGGFYIQPLSLATLSIGYNVPEDGGTNLVRVVAGFDF